MLIHVTPEAFLRQHLVADRAQHDIAPQSGREAPEDAHLANVCLQVARQIRSSGRRVIAFVPVGQGVACAPFALNLGQSLHELTRENVWVVDGGVHHPWLARQEVQIDGHRMADLVAVEVAVGLRFLSANPQWAKSQLSSDLPAAAGQRRLSALAWLSEKLAVCGMKSAVGGMESEGWALCDMTGLAETGELAEALELMQGAYVIVRAGQSTEAEVRATVRGIVATAFMGCVVTASLG
jgi:hypothetical protein